MAMGSTLCLRGVCECVSKGMSEDFSHKLSNFFFFKLTNRYLKKNVWCLKDMEMNEKTETSVLMRTNSLETKCCPHKSLCPETGRRERWEPSRRSGAQSWLSSIRMMDRTVRFCRCLLFLESKACSLERFAYVNNNKHGINPRLGPPSWVWLTQI